MSSKAYPNASHWGAFSVRTGRAGSRSPRTPTTRPRPRCSATSRAACGTPRGWPARPCGGAGSSTGRGRATGADATRSSRSAGTRRSTCSPPSSPGARTRQRGDLRRLVRLGQRRALPPRPEPAAPLPEPARRLHRVASTPTASARPRCCCRTSSAARERGAARAHDLAVDRRAHRAARGVRRHPGEERRSSRPAASPGTRAGPPGRRWPPAGSRVVLVSPLRDDLPELPTRVATRSCPAPTPR